MAYRKIIIAIFFGNILTVALAKPSKGFGGKVGLIDDVYRADLKFVGRKAAGSFAMQVPKRAHLEGPLGALLYFHGDGGAAGYRRSLKHLASIAEKRRLLPVSLATPTMQSWYDDGIMHAEYLYHFIANYLSSRYNIDNDRIYFAGVSGGAVFLGGKYLPVYGYKFGGGAIFLCGGCPTDYYGKGKKPYFFTNAKMLANFRMYFMTYQGDYIYKQTKEAFEDYKRLGFKIFGDFPKGGSHCGFNIFQGLEKGLAWIEASKS